jgi:cytidylate kinase
MLITIDGPAASGKSAVAAELAHRLGVEYRCLNTGAMYRAIAMLAVDAGLVQLNGHDRTDEPAVVELARRTRLDFDWTTDPPALLVNETVVPFERFESEAISRGASRVARIPGLRSVLVDQQRIIGARKPHLVTEGRDQGSVVFPDAPHKFFLAAMVDVRATRRFIQQWKRWEAGDRKQKSRPEFFQVLFELIRRDHQDTTSEHGRLVIPQGAVVIDTSEVEGVSRVVDRIVEVIRARPA